MEKGEIVEPRSAFGEVLVRLGQKYLALAVLSQDVSLSTKAIKFRQVFPEGFICSGISEQNTIGMAVD
jgi:transketolase C-terminal domain/subunit